MLVIAEYASQGTLCCAGESYAGIYIPLIAREILKGNARSDQHPINLKVYILLTSSVLKMFSVLATSHSKRMCAGVCDRKPNNRSG